MLEAGNVLTVIYTFNICNPHSMLQMFCSVLLCWSFCGDVFMQKEAVLLQKNGRDN